jgi:UPF0755 protein
LEPVKVPKPKTTRTRKPAFARVLKSLFVFAMLSGIAAAGLAFYGYLQFTAEGPLATKTVYVVSPGMKRAEVGAALQDAGIVRSASIFTAAAYVNGLRGGHLKAGEYEFPEHSSIDDVLGIITSGRTIAYKITIPEGWTSEMAAARIAENDVLTGDITNVPAEGSILPDTYVFRRGLTRQKMLDDMQAAQAKLLDTLWNARAPGTVLKSKEEAVVLASIVEKETGIPEERPLVASVFLNRLKQGIRLQSDPTIIYGIVGGKGKLDRALTKDDLASDTPFNTYKIDGLPPGPIANPGKASIEAVLNPPDTGYLYFVANGTGGHAFAKTLEEHNANVVKWRAIENGQAALVTTEAPTEVVVDGMPTPPAPAKGTAPATSGAAAAPAAEPVTPEVAAKPVTTATATAPDAASQAVAAKPAAAKPAAPAAPVATADAPLKPGSWIKLADQLVPIPRQKPKKQ